MDKQLFLHIGYPKTGTTTLQRNIFPTLRNDGFFYAGLDDDRNRNHAIEFNQQVHSPGDSQPPAHLLAENSLISNESILFDCFRFLDEAGSLHPRPITGLAERTQAVAHQWGAQQVQVIITLRTQGILSHSLYAQSYSHFFSRAPGLGSYRNYAARILANDPVGAAYDFASVIDNFQTVFGKPRVLVLLYEDLLKDTPAFLAKIAGFLGTPLPAQLPTENVRLTTQGERITQSVSLFEELSYLRHRWLPGWNPGIGKYLGFLRRFTARNSGVVQGDPQLEAAITRHFHASNHRLAELLERDLAPQGYY